MSLISCENVTATRLAIDRQVEPAKVTESPVESGPDDQTCLAIAQAWRPRLASDSSRASFRTLDAGVAVSRQFATAVYPTIWNASAARNTVPSSQWRPISMMPTGSPADMPAGTVVAGWPVTSNGQVLEIISSARAT